MIKVGIYPSAIDREKNTYFRMIEKCLSQLGFQTIDWNAAIFDSNAQYIILNFYENISKRILISALGKYIQKVAFLLVIKVLRKKIILTIHNKHPHDNGYPFFTDRLMKKEILLSDAIVGHTSITVDIIKDYASKFDDKKLFIVPHPLYEVVGEFEKISNIPTDSRRKMVLLFTGCIRKYKNIELIIRLAKEKLNDEIRFVISGACNDEEYIKKLKHMARGIENISFSFEYLDEYDLQKIISECDLLVLPYDKRSTLNSGMMHMAFSMGKTCICPDIGTAIDMPDGLLYIYHYDENSEESHFSGLKSSYEKAYKDFTEGTLIDKGLKCFEYVSKNNSQAVIAQEYLRVFKSIECRKY